MCLLGRLQDSGGHDEYRERMAEALVRDQVYSASWCLTSALIPMTVRGTPVREPNVPRGASRGGLFRV